MSNLVRMLHACVIVFSTNAKRAFYVPVNSKTAHPPGQTPGHLTFSKNFGQIPRYFASFDGQMPHPLELQRGSNLPPCHAMHSWQITNLANRILYYMEESVLLGTKPLVDSIHHFIRDPSGVFSVCDLCECRIVH